MGREHAKGTRIAKYCTLHNKSSYPDRASLLQGTYFTYLLQLRLKTFTRLTQNFIRTTATQNSGYDGKIMFTTEGNIQMHLAERDLNVAKNNGQRINPIETGHIAFRTDDIEQFKST